MPAYNDQIAPDELDEAKYIGIDAARHSSHAAIELAKYAYLTFLFYHTHQIRTVTHYHAKNWLTLIAGINLLPLTVLHITEQAFQSYRQRGRQHQWGLHLGASATNSIALMMYRYLSRYGMLGHIAANVLIVSAAMSPGKTDYQPAKTEANGYHVSETSSIARYKQQHGAFKCNVSVLNLLSTVWPLAIDYCVRRADHNHNMKIATYSLLGSAVFFYAMNIWTGVGLQRKVAKLPQLLERQDMQGYDGPRVIVDRPNSLRARLLPPFSDSVVVAGQSAQRVLLDGELEQAERGVVVVRLD
ncbi:MAG: hypothetical protein P1U63_08165 [Coxiellaceae bacterium]|nr:hypothetical protein [Coxiellaceae bacterium]